jgi:hypothetical protein
LWLVVQTLGDNNNIGAMRKKKFFQMQLTRNQSFGNNFFIQLKRKQFKYHGRLCTTKDRRRRNFVFKRKKKRDYY